MRSVSRISERDTPTQGNGSVVYRPISLHVCFYFFQMMFSQLDIYAKLILFMVIFGLSACGVTNTTTVIATGEATSMVKPLLAATDVIVTSTIVPTVVPTIVPLTTFTSIIATPLPTTTTPLLTTAMPLPTKVTPTPTIIELTLTPTPTPTAFPDLSLANRYLAELSEGIGRREAGTPNEALAAVFIEDAFEQMGYTPFTQPFSFTESVNNQNIIFNSANVIAFHPGLLNQEIIVGAHYDTVNIGQGADDNASGIAVMLTVAEKIQGIQTPYHIRFIAFGAEEFDLKGSNYYVAQMSEADIENTIAMINLDSLIAGDIAYIHGSAGEAGLIRDWVLAQATEANLTLQIQNGDHPDYPAGTTGDWSDHLPFKEVGIPYVYFEATNWGLGEKDGYTQVAESLGEQGEIWHTPYDTLVYINTTFPGRVDKHLNVFISALYTIVTTCEPDKCE